MVDKEEKITYMGLYMEKRILGTFVLSPFLEPQIEHGTPIELMFVYCLI